MKDIITGSLISLIAKIASASSTIIFTLLITRNLNTNESGLFLFFITIVLISSNLSRFGVDKHIVKELSSIPNKKNYIKYLYSHFIPIFLLSTILSTILYVDDCIILKYFFPNFNFETISFAFFTIPFYNTCLLIANFFQVKNKAYLYILALNFIQQAFTSIFIGIIYFTQKEISLVEICETYLISCVVSSILLLFYSIKLDKNVNKFRLENEIFFSSLKKSLPLFIVVIFNLTLNWSSQFVLATYTTPNEVSIFTVCLRLVMLISFILVAINSVTAPRYARFFNSGDILSVRKVFMLSIKISVAFSSIVTIFYLIFGEDLLLIFGNEYSSSHSILLVMMIGQIINVLCGSVSYVLQMKGEYKTVMIANVLSGFLSIFFAFILINHYGLLGAAIAYSLSLALLNLLLLSKVIPILKGL